MDGVAHLANDVVASQRDLHAQRDFFQQLAFRGDRRNPQVGTAHVHANGVVRHNA